MTTLQDAMLYQIVSLCYNTIAIRMSIYLARDIMRNVNGHRMGLCTIILPAHADDAVVAPPSKNRRQNNMKEECEDE